MLLRRLRGEVLIVTAATLWGTLGIAGKVAYSYGCTPGQLMLYRMLFLLPAILYLLPKVKRDNIIPLLVFGAFIVTPFYLIYFYAVKFVGASTAALILYTAPAYVAVMSVALLEERITLTTIIALVLALGGAALVNITETIRENLLGISTAFIAAILYATYTVGARILIRKGIESSHVALVPYLSSIPILGIYAAVIENHVAIENFGQLTAALYLALIPTGLAYVLYNYGLRTVEASRASILSTIEPVSATILAWIVLGEQLYATKVMGAGLIIISAIVVSKKRNEKY